jgi:hypothetical protein
LNTFIFKGPLRSGGAAIELEWLVMNRHGRPRHGSPRDGGPMPMRGSRRCRGNEPAPIRTRCPPWKHRQPERIKVVLGDNTFHGVYPTTYLMRVSDVLITKPSKLASYPLPRIFNERVGSHAAWGVIRSAEVATASWSDVRPQNPCMPSTWSPTRRTSSRCTAMAS